MAASDGNGIPAQALEPSSIFTGTWFLSGLGGGDADAETRADHVPRLPLLDRSQGGRSGFWICRV